jgi:hypothetical protein
VAKASLLGLTYAESVESQTPVLPEDAMLAIVELCHIVESGFLPLSCHCTVNANGSLTIKIFDSESGRVELLLPGVSTSDLTSIRSISNLIGELRTEIKAGRRAFAGGFSSYAG